jgi:hypothetical protein
MHKLILTLIACWNLSCYVNRIEPATPNVVITHVSVDTIFAKRKPTSWTTGVYPPIARYYYVNEYYIRIDGYENREWPVLDSKLTAVCFLEESKIQQIPLRPENIIRLSNRRFSVLFSLETLKSGYVGFTIATEGELRQQSQHSYFDYLKSNQIVFLKGVVK